jgi:hypothetical protein
MTVYLISLALAGLVAIALWEDIRERSDHSIHPAAAPQRRTERRNRFLLRPNHLTMDHADTGALRICLALARNDGRREEA